jgi:hypothetical protein
LACAASAWIALAVGALAAEWGGDGSGKDWRWGWNGILDVVSTLGVWTAAWETSVSQSTCTGAAWAVGAACWLGTNACWVGCTTDEVGDWDDWVSQ